MNRQLGGVQTVFRGPMYQEGYGLGGYFRKFFKWIVPIAEKHVLPHLKSGIEAVGQQTVESLSNIAKDTIQGKNIKESTNQNLNAAIDNLKNRAKKHLNGEALKRKNKKSHFIYKKRKNKDIFDQ
jgi:hypothetical protein